MYVARINDHYIHPILPPETVIRPGGLKVDTIFGRFKKEGNLVLPTNPVYYSSGKRLDNHPLREYFDTGTWNDKAKEVVIPGGKECILVVDSDTRLFHSLFPGDAEDWCVTFDLNLQAASEILLDNFPDLDTFIAGMDQAAGGRLGTGMITMRVSGHEEVVKRMKGGEELSPKEVLELLAPKMYRYPNEGFVYHKR